MSEKDKDSELERRIERKRQRANESIRERES